MKTYYHATPFANLIETLDKRIEIIPIDDNNLQILKEVSK